MKSVIIVGGGIVGLAVARQLTMKGYRNLTILEKESDIVMHQSSRNSEHACGSLLQTTKLKAKIK